MLELPPEDRPPDQLPTAGNDSSNDARENDEGSHCDLFLSHAFRYLGSLCQPS
jgi:hypothetical protein